MNTINRDQFTILGNKRLLPVVGWIQKDSKSLFNGAKRALILQNRDAQRLRANGTSFCQNDTQGRPETSLWAMSLRLCTMEKELGENFKRTGAEPSSLGCLYPGTGQFHW